MGAQRRQDESSGAAAVVIILILIAFLSASGMMVWTTKQHQAQHRAEQGLMHQQEIPLPPERPLFIPR